MAAQLHLNNRSHHLRGPYVRRDRQALFQTARRNQQRHDQLYNDDDYFWSTDKRGNDRFQEEYCVGLTQRIKDRAILLGLEIHPADVTWLDEHEGYFMQYEHPLSAKGKEKLNHSKYKEEPYTSYTEAQREDEIIGDIRDRLHVLLTESPRFGNRAPSTQYNYENFLSHFWRFLIIVGRIDELFIFFSHPPGGVGGHKCPSVSPESIVQYIHHIHQQPRSIVTINGHPNGEPLRDTKGRTVRAEGTTQNSKWIDSFVSAVRIIHAGNGITGDYQAQCDGCFAAHQQGSHTACAYHTGQRQHYYHSGLPTEAGIVMEAKVWMRAEMERRGYVADSKTPFLPSDIENIQLYMAGNGFRPLVLQFFSLMRLAQTCGGLRFDHAHEMTVENIEDCHLNWDILTHAVDCIALKVKEKTDTQWYIYKLGFNDHAPEQCTLRHLLTHLHCTQIVEGPIFPIHYELTEAIETAGEFTTTTPVPYQHFGDFLRDMHQLMATAGELADWGPHSCRSTFYLLSVCGGGEIHDIMRNARHVDLATAMKYYKDAKHLKELILRHPNLRARQRVAPFQDALVWASGCTSARVSMMIENRRSINKIQDVCKLYVERMLNVDPSDPNYRNPQFLLQRSYALNFAQITPQDHFVQHCHNLLPANLRDSVLSHFHMYCHSSQTIPRHPAAVVAAAPPQTAAVEEPHSIAEETGILSGQPPGQRGPVVALPPLAVGPFNWDPNAAGRREYRYLEWYRPDPSFPATQARINKEYYSEQMRGNNVTKRVQVLCYMVDEMASLVPPEVGAIENRYLQARSKLDPKCAPFLCKTVTPFVKCFYGCHKSDLARFQETNPTFKYGTFNKKNSCQTCRAVAAG